MWRSKRPGRIRAGSRISGPVGGGHDDHPFAGVEAVHFGQHLVQGVFPFFRAPHGRKAPGLADGVQFVDEDDAGGLLLGRGKEIPHPGGAHPHEHFHKIGAGQAHKGHPGLSGHGPGQQGLAGARGTHQQDAFGEVAPQNLKFGRVLQELDDFLQFLFGFFHPGHILEGDLGFVLDINLGLALAHGHEAAGAAADLPEEVDPDADEEHEGEAPRNRRDVSQVFSWTAR